MGTFSVLARSLGRTCLSLLEAGAAAALPLGALVAQPAGSARSTTQPPGWRRSQRRASPCVDEGSGEAPHPASAVDIHDRVVRRLAAPDKGVPITSDHLRPTPLVWVASVKYSSWVPPDPPGCGACLLGGREAGREEQECQRSEDQEAASSGAVISASNSHFRLWAGWLRARVVSQKYTSSSQATTCQPAGAGGAETAVDVSTPSALTMAPKRCRTSPHHVDRRKLRLRRPRAAQADVAVGIDGQRGREVIAVRGRRQNLPAAGRRRWPGSRTRRSRTASRSCASPHCRRRCCRHGRRRTSCAGPRRRVVCLPGRVEPPDSAVKSRSGRLVRPAQRDGLGLRDASRSCRTR